MQTQKHSWKTFAELWQDLKPPRKIFEKALQKHFKIIDSDINKTHPVYKCYRIYFAKSSPAS